MSDKWKTRGCRRSDHKYYLKYMDAITEQKLNKHSLWCISQIMIDWGTLETLDQKNGFKFILELRISRYHDLHEIIANVKGTKNLVDQRFAKEMTLVEKQLNAAGIKYDKTIDTTDARYQVEFADCTMTDSDLASFKLGII